MITDLAVQRALDRLARKGCEALSETERTVATTWLFAAGVSNTGFAGYFSGARGDLAFNGPAALRAIGAAELAAIAEEANAVFGPGGPPRDRKERRRALRALAPEARRVLDALDQRYFDCEENIDDLVEAFLAQAGAGAGPRPETAPARPSRR
jgi:hypothetical protein